MTLRRKLNFSDRMSSCKESNAHTHAAHAAVNVADNPLAGNIGYSLSGLRV